MNVDDVDNWAEANQRYLMARLAVVRESLRRHIARTQDDPPPPPEIDVHAWDASLDEIERRAPARLALIHFGTVDADIPDHLARLRARLHAWEALVERGLSEAEFLAAMREDLRSEVGDAADAYAAAAPPGAYAGLKRWVEKVRPSRSQATGAA